MKNVLILGATSDIALAIAELFAKNGFSLSLAGRNIKKLEPIQSDLEIRFKTNVDIYEFDAVQYDSHDTFFKSLKTAPFVTICVFGLLGNQSQSEKHWNKAENVIATNYTGAVSILNVVANFIENKEEGTIIGISSVAGERGRKSNYIYGSAKAGFTAYLSGLRNRLSHVGGHVITVNPGFVYTSMTEGLELPKLLTAQPKEVAQVVYKAYKNKKNVVYVKWFWRWIMLIIKLIPEFIFKKMNL